MFDNPVEAIVPIGGKPSFIESNESLGYEVGYCAGKLAPFVPLTATQLAPLLYAFLQRMREGNAAATEPDSPT